MQKKHLTIFRVLLIQYKTPDKIRIFVLPVKSFFFKYITGQYSGTELCCCLQEIGHCQNKAVRTAWYKPSPLLANPASYPKTPEEPYERSRHQQRPEHSHAKT